jgi:hypothetical protein
MSASIYLNRVSGLWRASNVSEIHEIYLATEKNSDQVRDFCLCMEGNEMIDQHGRGRPKLAKSKNKQISVRLTQSEYELLIAKIGYGKIAVHIRNLILGTGERQRVTLSDQSQTAWRSISTMTDRIDELMSRLEYSKSLTRGTLRSEIETLRSYMTNLKLIILNGQNGDR